MKKFFLFFNDFALIFVFLLMVSAAFLGTYGLSPVFFAHSSLARNSDQTPDIAQDDANEGQVFGEFDDSGLNYIDNFETHDYFSVESIRAGLDYTAKIEVGPVSTGHISKSIVKIENPSASAQSVGVSILIAERDSSIVDISVFANNQNQKIADASKEVIIDIYPGETKEIDLEMNVKQKINYPLGIDLQIEQK